MKLDNANVINKLFKVKVRPVVDHTISALSLSVGRIGECNYVLFSQVMQKELSLYSVVFRKSVGASSCFYGSW